MTDEKTSTERRVAFQGERGAFSEDAARQLLGGSVETLACRTFDQMFGAVAAGDAACAVAPIENSLAGSVHKNYDLLMEHNLTIIGETNVRIAHNLIALPGVALAEIRSAHSHPVALAQCEKFFRNHPQIEAVPAYDTAGSVKIVIERGDRQQAAIAGANAAEVYGAEIVARNIEDNPQNFTRFLLLANPDRAGSIKPAGSSERKTSIVFRVANQPGSLFRALAVFSLRDIDMTKIESRPIEGRPWEYSFYLDVAGDRHEPNLERALAHLGEMTESIRVLGSYPRAKET